MPWRLYRANGFHDVLAVGPGRAFNPGAPHVAQEMVDQRQVVNIDGRPVPPWTPYADVLIDVSADLWSVMAGWRPQAPR